MIVKLFQLYNSDARSNMPKGVFNAISHRLNGKLTAIYKEREEQKSRILQARFKANKDSTSNTFYKAMAETQKRKCRIAEYEVTLKDRSIKNLTNPTDVVGHFVAV